MGQNGRKSGPEWSEMAGIFSNIGKNWHRKAMIFIVEKIWRPWGREAMLEYFLPNYQTILLRCSPQVPQVLSSSAPLFSTLYIHAYFAAAGSTYIVYIVYIVCIRFFDYSIYSACA